MSFSLGNCEVMYLGKCGLNQHYCVLNSEMEVITQKGNPELITSDSLKFLVHVLKKTKSQQNGGHQPTTTEDVVLPICKTGASST